MGNTVTRAKVFWFVSAAILGGASVVLNLYRSSLRSAESDAILLQVGGFVTLGLTVICVYRGIMVAAREQDAAGQRADREREIAERLARWEGLRPKDR